MALPKFLQHCLPSYDLKSLDEKRDASLIITQILNQGDGQALRWLGNNYSRKEIKRVISSPTRGLWLKFILLYWLRIFNLKLDKKNFDKAIINLHPF